MVTNLKGHWASRTKGPLRLSDPMVSQHCSYSRGLPGVSTGKLPGGLQDRACIAPISVFVHMDKILLGEM